MIDLEKTEGTMAVAIIADKEDVYGRSEYIYGNPASGAGNRKDNGGAYGSGDGAVLF